MPKGYRNGFNPFRKGGKFASASGADASSDSGAAAAADALGVKNDTIGSAGTGAMNATIRSAAGRGGAGDATSAPAITAAVLQRIDALPAGVSKLTPATRAALEPLLKGNLIPFEEGGLNGAAAHILMNPEGITAPARKALLQAFKEQGFDAPAGANDGDLLAAMDAVTEASAYSETADNRTSYGISLALKANRPEVASTLADSPEGAGIGWVIMRQSLGAPAEEGSEAAPFGFG